MAKTPPVRGRRTFDLDDLIRRMTAREPHVTSSAQSVSWHAHRDAEKVNDPSLLPRLAELCESEEGNVRGAAYFVTGCLGHNTGDPGAATLLLDRCAVETQPGPLSTTLGGLEKQARFPFTPALAKLVKHPSFSVRFAAINALVRCPSPRAEAALLGVLRQSKNRYDLTYGFRSLLEVATRRSLPTVRRFLTHDYDQLRANALRVMARVGGHSLLPVFLRALQRDRSAYVKAAAVLGIRLHGNATAVPVVLDRLKAVLSRKRNVVHLGRTEVNDAVEFLDRFRHADRRIESLFEAILTKWADRLFEAEADELRRNVPYFAAL
jgi:HEAT repeat protein